MKNWKVEVTAGGKTSAEVKEDVLSLILFVIAMMPLDYISRKCTEGYKLIKSQEKINPLMYMDDIKQFTKNEKELGTLIQTIRIYSQDKGIKFSIEKCPVLIMKSGKRQITEGIELPNQERIRRLGEKANYKYSEILEVDTIKQVEMKEKIRVPLAKEKTP